MPVPDQDSALAAERIAATCIAWGIGIASEIALPGAMASPADHPAEIIVAFGDAPAWQPRTSSAPYRIEDADRFEVAVPGVARFTCLARRRVLVAPAPTAGTGAIAAMLIATVLPALLWARGEFLLHGAAAIRPGASRGTIVAGASGSGKSTLLRHATAVGRHAIGDDSVCLRMVSGLVTASGLPGGSWRGPADGDRNFIPVAAGQQRSEAPVRRLILLEPDLSGRRRLRGADAAAALLRHRHRPRIAALLGTEPGFLPSIARFADMLDIVAIPAALSAPAARNVMTEQASPAER